MQAAVQEVPTPTPSPGEAIVSVRRAGICGTDLELYRGEMQYLRNGLASFPLRIGHEWMGVVSQVGASVDEAWIGRRVTGDTMIGCGACSRCLAGYHHVCDARFELGVRGGLSGALAEMVAVPTTSLRLLPDSVDDAAGALVEPGGNAFRSVEATMLDANQRLLIIGAGTIGLLCAMFARAKGLEVHLLVRHPESTRFAQRLGFVNIWHRANLPTLAWDAVIDASNSPEAPAQAVRLVEPGRRVVFVGLAGQPSRVDTRDIALADITVIGILGASRGLRGTIDKYATGEVDPRPLIAATIQLEELPHVLAGARPPRAGDGPKVHVAIAPSTAPKST